METGSSWDTFGDLVDHQSIFFFFHLRLSAFICGSNDLVVIPA